MQSSRGIMMKTFSAVALLVLLLARDACCIRCYSCSSNKNENCWHPLQNKLQTTVCNLSAANETQRNAKDLDEDFNRLFEIDLVSQLPMNCLKQVTKVGNKEIVIRGCQLAPARDLSICKKVQEEAGKKRMEITHCSLCSSDACNSGPKISYSEATLCLVTFAAIFSLRL